MRNREQTAPYYPINIKITHLLTSLTLVQLSVYIRFKYDGKVYRIVLLLLSNITFYSSPVAFFSYFFASFGSALHPSPFSNIYEVNLHAPGLPRSADFLA